VGVEVVVGRLRDSVSREGDLTGHSNVGSIDLDLGDMEVVLSGQLDSEGAGKDVGNVEGEDGLVVMSVLLPDGMVQVLGQSTVVEGRGSEQDVEVAQSLLALIGSVLDDDSIHHLGGIKVHLPPFLVGIVGVVE